MTGYICCTEMTTQKRPEASGMVYTVLTPGICILVSSVHKLAFRTKA